MGLQVSIRESGDITILDLRGRSTIDSGESEQLGSCLEKLLASGVRKFLLNLADLTQVDSSGLSIIAKTCVSIRRKGGDLKFLCPRGRVLAVIKVLHLQEVIRCFEDETEALASFRQRDYATH